jgi:hypothetical protein
MTHRYQEKSQEFTNKAADQNVGAGATGNRVSDLASPSGEWVAELIALRSGPNPLQVSKTVATTFTRTFNWTIDKSVEPDTLHLFKGDSGTSEYTVTLTKSAPVDAAAVSGNITITNPNGTGIDATITGVTDVVSPSINASVDCGVGVSFPYVLAGGGTLNCAYSASLTSADSTTNTATVTTSGAVAGGSDTEDVIFGAPTLVNDSVTVTDSVEGDLGTFNVSRSEEYSRTFTCDADEGTHGNIARINEIQSASDSASVMVNCHELEVTKTVETEFTRTWEWTIEKLGDQTALTLAEGEPFLVNYTVTVEAEKQDSDHAISGTITIYNPAPIDASITNVSDQVSGTVTVTCHPENFPQTLAADEDLVCDYEGELDNGDATENTATVTIQNTPSGTTDFIGKADVAFDEPTTEVDECVDVSDSEDTGNMLPAEACAPDPAPFDYSRFIGPFEQCGEQQAVNTASFISNDTDADDESTYTVTATVEGCGGGGDDGCTLSQGYWKTHSSHGPAPYDATWDGLENTKFFEPKNTQTFYQVLWTAPKGNAYYILAHQYIAAQLNELNNANFEDAQTAYDAATALFGQYTPAQIALLKVNNAVRQQFISYAGTLGDYNSGITGPGHCDEDGTTAP